MNWNNVKNKKPIAAESGDWDGLRSDKVLVCDKYGTYHIAVMYEGFLDGSDFCDFFDNHDFEVKDVVFWLEIKAPF
jgi:hypothetical protein